MYKTLKIQADLASIKPFDFFYQVMPISVSFEEFITHYKRLQFLTVEFNVENLSELVLMRRFKDLKVLPGNFSPHKPNQFRLH